jgi:hypothetical protein
MFRQEFNAGSPAYTYKCPPNGKDNGDLHSTSPSLWLGASVAKIKADNRKRATELWRFSYVNKQYPHSGDTQSPFKLK